MKRYKYILLGVVASLTLTSCNDWLLEPSPGTTELEDFFTSGTTCKQAVVASYTPLMWEYNGTYFSEWFIGDIASDDALKGGQSTGDMADAYDIENFKTISNNGLLLDYYRAQYQGISRCNLALANIPSVATDDTMDSSLKERYLGEAYFLRAYYYFRLVRLFGDVPLTLTPITNSDDWKSYQRVDAEIIWEQIISDLEKAEERLWLKSQVDATEMGIATKGAAQAMLMKAYLYQGKYEEARLWGEKLIAMGDGGEYSLLANYADNFTAENENGKESVFEIQYMNDPTSDYGEGYGFTRGTFTTILVRSRSSAFGDAGWGFNKPTQNLYDEFEEGDIRRDATILNPTDDQIQTPEQEIYLGSRYLNNKYSDHAADGSYIKLAHHSRGEQNCRLIRYSDVLLMYAEACLGSGVDLDKGLAALNRVRSRATLSAISTLDWQSLRHERRVELAMEGHRWFDLCRWGIVKEVMDAYKASESAEARAEMAEFIAGKHELMPIPQEEVRLGGLTQNPGY